MGVGGLISVDFGLWIGVCFGPEIANVVTLGTVVLFVFGMLV